MLCLVILSERRLLLYHVGRVPLEWVLSFLILLERLQCHFSSASKPPQNALEVFPGTLRSRPWYSRRTRLQNCVTLSSWWHERRFVTRSTVSCFCYVVRSQLGNISLLVQQLLIAVDLGPRFLVLHESHSWYWRSFWYLLGGSSDTGMRHSARGTCHTPMGLVLNKSR